MRGLRSGSSGRVCKIICLLLRLWAPLFERPWGLVKVSARESVRERLPQVPSELEKKWGEGEIGEPKKKEQMKRKSQGPQ